MLHLHDTCQGGRWVAGGVVELLRLRSGEEVRAVVDLECLSDRGKLLLHGGEDGGVAAAGVVGGAGQAVLQGAEGEMGNIDI